MLHLPISLVPILRALCLLALAHALSHPLLGDEIEAVRAWSGFGAIDTARLNAGQIELKTNTSMKLPRALSAQALYVVEGTPAGVAAALLKFDPTAHPELDVFQHRRFRAEADAGFDQLRLDGRTAALRRLLAETAAPKSLQLSTAERSRLPKDATVRAAQEFWGNLLRERWQHFVAKGIADRVESCDLHQEIGTLLSEVPQWAARFAPLLGAWNGAAAPPAPAFYTWDISETQGLANVEFGVIYSRADGERRQVADLTLYSSSSYFTAITLYEFAPLPGNRRTLVWQGVLVSSDQLAGAFGLKRKIAGKLTSDDLQQWIRIFREDVIHSAR